MKTATAPIPPLRSVKVLDQLRDAYATALQFYEEQAYVNWVRAFIRFHGVRHRQPWAAAKSGISAVLAGERAQGFSLHASSGIGNLAVLLRQGAVPEDLPWLQEIGRPRPSRRCRWC